MIALSSLPLYQAVRHPLCFSSWLILCFSALSEEMPGWIMSEPEYDLPHPVLGVRLPSLNPHCTGASTSELEQLCGLQQGTRQGDCPAGRRIYGRTMRIFHVVTFYCALMCCHEPRESPGGLISGFSILSSFFVYWACFYWGFSTNEIKVFFLLKELWLWFMPKHEFCGRRGQQKQLIGP